MNQHHYKIMNNTSIGLTGNNVGKVMRTGQQRRNNNNNNNNQRGRRRQQRRRGRGRGRQRGSIMVDMRYEPYALHHCIKPETIAYAESVVCPFNMKGLGSVRPDEVHTTAAATDKLQVIIPFTTLATYVQENANVQNYWPGLELQGVAVWFMPRCTQAGWLDSKLTSSTDSEVTVETKVTNFGLSSTFKGSLDLDTKYPIFNPALCYTIGLAFLGTNGRFYGYGQVNESPPATLKIFEGYNTIQTTRINLLIENFSALRVNGVGMKLWTNAPPINTGGYCFGGEMALQDLYSALAGDNNALTSLTIQDGIKHRAKYQAVDGVTTRYNSLVEKKQSVIQDVYLEGIQRQPDAEQVALSPSDDIFILRDLYVIPNEYEYQSKDLASQSTLVPIQVWQFGTNTPYDLSFESIFHLEGRTVGNCPFEVQQEHVDPYLDHLDKILRSPAFPVVSKGHTFKHFIEKAKQIVGRGHKEMTNLVRIAKLVEEFLGKV
jgi:hypothetical protein